MAGMARARLSPVDCVNRIAAALNAKQYRQAYNFISKPLQEEMSYRDFHDAAERVKSIQIVFIRVIQQTPTLARMRVTAQTVEKDENGTTWKKQDRTGDLVFIPEKQNWRIIQIDLLTEQKQKPKAMKR